MITYRVAFFFLFNSLLGMAQEKCSQIDHGDSTAPLKIIEYASPTCTICSEFSNLIFPKIDRYIHEKKIRLTIINLPYNAIDLKVCSLIRHSPDPKNFNTFIYQNQKKWLFSKNPIQTLRALLEKKGMSRNQIKKALRNKEFEDNLIKQRLIEEKKYEINAIPSLMIGQKKIIGLIPWNKLKLVIDSALKHIEDGNSLETFGRINEENRVRKKTSPTKKEYTN